jgi:tRNA (guanine-N7-)-methyltransferase
MSDADENGRAREVTSPGQPQDLRSYGRRRGRKLSPRQERLIREILPRVSPRLADAPPRDPALLFAPPVREVWFEIGFGGGEHLLWQAHHHADIGFLGAEPFEDGVVKVLAEIEDQHRTNVKIHADDARDLLRWLPPACLGRVFILFPDPWPKRRHLKRRLVNARLLSLLARVMRPGAELRIATDIGDYARTILTALQASDAFEWVARSPADWRERPADWPATRYEKKAHREGRRCYYLRFDRLA